MVLRTFLEHSYNALHFLFDSTDFSLYSTIYISIDIDI